jgi:hypothetical protein
MGCSTQHTKDFIQLLKTAKKIINYIKAFMLFYILPPPNLTGAPERSNAPPLRSLTVARPLLFLHNRARVVGCCVKSFTGSLLKPRQISDRLVFLLVIRWPKRCDHVLPNHLCPARRLSQINPSNTADFRLVVVSSHTAGAMAI